MIKLTSLCLLMTTSFCFSSCNTASGDLNISCDEFEIIHQIIRQYDLKILALTKGAKGSWLVSDQEDSYLDTPNVPVKDTVGAGDSFTAALVAGLLKGKPLKKIHQNAVDISAYVCTQKGATPNLPDHLIQ